MNLRQIACGWKYIFFILIIITGKTVLLAQRKTKASIDRVQIAQIGAKLDIKFDLNRVKRKEHFHFDIKVMTKIGEDLGARTFNRNWMTPILIGKRKQSYHVSWDIKKDGYFFDEELYVVINAQKVHKVNPFKATVMAIAFPGWGNNHIHPRRKGYFVLGGIAYSSAAFSILMEIKTRISYKSYLGADSLLDRNQFFTNAREQRLATNAGIGVTAAIWTGTLTWTLIESIRKRSRERKSKTKNVGLSLGNQGFMLFANF